MEFRSPVNRVCLSRSSIVVALYNTVHVYAFAIPPEKLSEYETANNPLGLCCLGSKIIAFPGRTPGQVQLVEIATGNISIIPAHSSPLRAIELSPDGEVLATASETGTLVRTFSTANCARTGELRRGVDQAAIFSIGISPSSRLLALTSDKATLHIFDLPHPMHGPRSDSPAGRSLRSLNTSDGDESNRKKWGVLGNIPLMPRVFSDVYSFASAHFEIDDDPKSGLGGQGENMPIPGLPGGRPKKGVIGWIDENALLVVGAGRDGRWEKFIIGEDDDGKRRCIRQGWKRYLGN